MAQKYKSYSGIKGSGILINTTLPLDPRQVVEYKEDLTKKDTWTGTGVYRGMMVSVLEDQAVYMYTPPIETYDPTKSEYWKKISSPDVQISGQMVDIIEYQADPQSALQYYNKIDCHQEGEKWVPNEGAELIDDPSVIEAGKYLCLEVGEDKVYINSKNLIDLDDYVTKDELDASLRTASMEDASNGIDGLATAVDVYTEIQKAKGNVQWEDEIHNENTEN